MTLTPDILLGFPGTPYHTVFAGKFPFKGHFGSPSICRLEVYSFTGSALKLVVATELLANPGTSITNAAESLWQAVTDEYRLAPGDHLFERYEESPKVDRVLLSHTPATGAVVGVSWQRFTGR